MVKYSSRHGAVGWTYNPQIDYIRIDPIKTIGEYSIVDVYVADEEPVRYFLRNNKVILLLSDTGNFMRLEVTTPPNERNKRKIRHSATGRYTIYKLLEKIGQHLISACAIRDSDVLKYIPPSVLTKFGYNVSPEIGRYFIIGRPRIDDMRKKRQYDTFN